MSAGGIMSDNVCSCGSQLGAVNIWANYTGICSAKLCDGLVSCKLLLKAWQSRSWTSEMFLAWEWGLRHLYDYSTGVTGLPVSCPCPSTVYLRYSSPNDHLREWVKSCFVYSKPFHGTLRVKNQNTLASKVLCNLCFLSYYFSDFVFFYLPPHSHGSSQPNQLKW